MNKQVLTEDEMEDGWNGFQEYLKQEILKHEELLENAYKTQNSKHINNNCLILEKLVQVEHEFKMTILKDDLKREYA